MRIAVETAKRVVWLCLGDSVYTGARSKSSKSSPVGGRGALVGRHGAMKPSGRGMSRLYGVPTGRLNRGASERRSAG